MRAGRASLEDMVRLAVLYVEPLHEEEKAIELLDSIVKRNPSADEAKLWLAYCCLHFLMDQSALRRASGLLQNLIEAGGELSGAASMLLAEVMDELEDSNLDRKIALLEASVRKNPDWVYNRTRLARAYKDGHQSDRAIAQMEIAIQNIRPNDREADPFSQAFEDAFVGRQYKKEYLLEERRDLTRSD